MTKNRVQRTARKAAPTKTAAKPKSWNNSEILYAVLGYLTTREMPLILSAKHDAAPVAEILKQIADANGLPAVRSNYPKIKIPEGLEGITNWPIVATDTQANCGPAPKKTPDETASEVLNHVLRQSPEDQNKIMSIVVKTIAKARKKEYEYLNQERSRFNDGIETALRNNAELANILKESF